jgi:hypothetical protein
MSTTKNITLVKGSFTVEEAKDILLTLLNNKINFHQMKNFSLVERFGMPEFGSQKRIDELKLNREELTDFFKSAEAKNLTFSIDSVIQIRMNESN